VGKKLDIHSRVRAHEESERDRDDKAEGDSLFSLSVNELVLNGLRSVARGLEGALVGALAGPPVGYLLARFGVLRRSEHAERHSEVELSEEDKLDLKRKMLAKQLQQYGMFRKAAELAREQLLHLEWKTRNELVELGELPEPPDPDEDPTLADEILEKAREVVEQRRKRETDGDSGDGSAH